MCESLLSNNFVYLSPQVYPQLLLNMAGYEPFAFLISSLGKIAKDSAHSFSESIKQNPQIKKGVIKAGASFISGLTGLAFWSHKRKKNKQDELDKNERELEQARALEEIKTEGYAERLNLRQSGQAKNNSFVAHPKRTTASESDTLADIDERVGELPEAIIPGALFPGDICTLAGENHSGKSALLYHIGLRLAKAEDVGITESGIRPSSRYDVLIYDRENSDATLKKRYGSIDVPNFRIIRGEDFQSIGDLLDDLELQLERIQRERVLICIDNATAYKMPTSGNKITDFYTRLQSIINKASSQEKQLTVIIAVHLSAKNESAKSSTRVLGATQLISGASANWYIKNTRFGKKDKILKVEKNRIEDCPEQALLLHINGLTPLAFEFKQMIDEGDAIPNPGKRFRTIAIDDKSMVDDSEAKPDPRCKLTNVEIADIVRRQDAEEHVDLKAIADEKGVALKTIYKWIKKYRQTHK